MRGELGEDSGLLGVEVDEGSPAVLGKLPVLPDAGLVPGAGSGLAVEAFLGRPGTFLRGVADSDGLGDGLEELLASGYVGYDEGANNERDILSDGGEREGEAGRGRRGIGRIGREGSGSEGGRERERSTRGEGGGEGGGEGSGEGEEGEDEEEDYG